MANIVMAKYFHTSLAYIEDELRSIRLSKLSRLSRNLSPSEKRRMLMKEREGLLNNKETEGKKLVLLYKR